MAGWQPWLNGREFEQSPADSEGQGSLASCSPWGGKEPDTTEQLKKEREASLMGWFLSCERCQSFRDGEACPGLGARLCAAGAHRTQSWILRF